MRRRLRSAGVGSDTGPSTCTAQVPQVPWPRQWTARAYLKRAEALHKLYQDQKASEVLTEMLQIPGIDEFPETVEARALAKKLRGEA